jgi:hypothetical protein
MSWIVSIITASIMFAIGVFWMFVWLVGTNGYSEKIGTAILAGNLVLVIISTIAAALASGGLAKRFVTKTGKSPLIVAPLCIIASVTAAVAIMFIVSIIIVTIAEAAR